MHLDRWNDLSFNWREQEADEVGYELYFRAGFEPSEMSGFERSLIVEEEYQKCLDDRVKLKVLPTRGTRSHPEHCWRIYDRMVLEPEFDEDVYAPLMENAKTVTLFPGELDALKPKLQ